MKQQARIVLKSKFFLGPVVFLSLILIIVFTYYSSIGNKVIFPNSAQFTCDYYTDSLNGGNSKVVNFEISDSLIKLEYQLNDGFPSPYVGLSLTPLQKDFLNARKFNQVKLTIAGHGIDRVGFALYTPPLLTTGYGKNDETINHIYVSITGNMQTYKISLSELKHPEWWDDLHRVSDTDKTKPEFDKILHINLSSAYAPDIIGKKEIMVYAIVFDRNNKFLFTLACLFYFILVIANFFIIYLPKKREEKRSNIKVTYQPIEISGNSTVEDNCLNFINVNYNMSDLSLEKIAEEVAISPRQITKLIHEKFECNFKTYLNNIRISESKRLLLHTNLNIGEVAFKVGFNSQSHFNRVFKNELHISPSEFKARHTS